MKAFYLLLISALFSFFSVTLVAQTIEIPYASPPVVDGERTGSEWDSIPSYPIYYGSSLGCNVLICHDSTAFYLLYEGYIETALKFPELLIDADFDRSGRWEQDDWWFHVSATDCVFQGQNQNYDSCITQPTSWWGMPNMIRQSWKVDTVEMYIPFSKIGKTINDLDSIGICFEMMSAMGGAYSYFPPNAHIDTPRTWSKAVIERPEPISTHILELESLEAKIYPNPSSSGQVKLSWTGTAVESIKVGDILGNTILDRPVAGFSSTSIDLGNQPEGVYLVWFYSKSGELLDTSKVAVLR